MHCLVFYLLLCEGLHAEYRYAEYYYAECHYAECRYAECLGTHPYTPPSKQGYQLMSDQKQFFIDISNLPT